MDEGAFAQPVHLRDVRGTVVTIDSVMAAGTFLVTRWPTNRRQRKAYRAAVRAAVMAIGGTGEPEACRQALLAALEDLAGRSSPVIASARAAAAGPVRLQRRGEVP